MNKNQNLHIMSKVYLISVNLSSLLEWQFHIAVFMLERAYIYIYRKNCSHHSPLSLYFLCRVNCRCAKKFLSCTSRERHFYCCISDYVSIFHSNTLILNTLCENNSCWNTGVIIHSYMWFSGGNSGRRISQEWLFLLWIIVGVVIIIISSSSSSNNSSGNSNICTHLVFNMLKIVNKEPGLVSWGVLIWMKYLLIVWFYNTYCLKSTSHKGLSSKIYKLFNMDHLLYSCEQHEHWTFYSVPLWYLNILCSRFTIRLQNNANSWQSETPDH